MNENKITLLSNDTVGEECIRVDHKSGLTIFITKKPFSSAYAVLGTRYGSCDNVFKSENENDFCAVPEGIAHFLEHKMFESEDGHDAFEDFARTGADANAYTSTDRTAYLFSCTDDFYTNLETLLRMVTTPVFTEKNVKKEQGIIGQEIKMCLDRPSNALFYNLMKAMYKSNPVREQIAGSIESIAKITPELLYKCYNVFYGLSNMALCVAGDIDESKIIELADKILPIKENEKIVLKEIGEPAECAEKSISVQMEVAKPLFRIGIKDTDGSPDDAAAVAILIETLFGESSDFYSSLYEEGLISAYSCYSEYTRPSCFTVLGGDSDNPEEVFARFCDYTKSVIQNGIPRDDFERAKRVIYADTIKAFDSSESIAEGLFDAFLVSSDYLSQADKYSAVTHGQITALAKRILRDECYCLSTVYPKGTEGR